MSQFEVNSTQLVVYLVFTLLSIVVSISFYCAYQHCFDLSEKDYRQYTAFYMNLGRRSEETSES